MKTGTFSPSDVCRFLLISKSTLLRWEREGLIPKPVRKFQLSANEQRMYSVRNIATIAKKKYKAMQTNEAKMNDRGLEVLYRVQLFFDVTSAIANLESLAAKHLIGDETLKILADEALCRPRSSSERKMLLELLLLNG
jgi:MerR family regulatory protein